MPEPQVPTRARRPDLPWQVWVAATVLALLAAGGVLAFAAAGSSDEAEAPTGSTIPLTPLEDAEGDPLAVTLTDVDDTAASLAERLDGRPTVVNFFASWCPPCVKEMPAFEAVHDQLADEVAFLGVAVTDRPEDVTEIVERTGITYPYTRDIRGDMAGAAQVVQMPSTMFVSADGEVVEVHAGAVDEAGLRELIEEHLGVVP